MAPPTYVSLSAGNPRRSYFASQGWRSASGCRLAVNTDVFTASPRSDPAAGVARHARWRVTRPRSMPFCAPPVGGFSSQRPSAHTPWLRKRLRVSLGVTTSSPQDHARRDFRLLRHEPRPAVSIGALTAVCSSGPLTAPRLALLGLRRALTSPCPCHSGVCRTHGWHLPAGTRSLLRKTLMLETDLFARPGVVDPDFLQWFSLGSGGCPWDCNWAGMFALCAPRLSRAKLRHPRSHPCQSTSCH
jgi:hypothetical protein